MVQWIRVLVLWLFVFSAQAEMNLLNQDALWISEQQQLTQQALADNSLLLTRPGIIRARVLAVDPQFQQIWSYRQGVIETYDFSGNSRFQIELPIPDDDTDFTASDTAITPTPKQARALALQIDDQGNAWLGRNQSLLVFDHNGTLLWQQSLSHRLKAMTLDNNQQTAWLATTQHLLAYQINGNLSRTIALDGIQDIAVDSANQVLWVVRKNSLERYILSGDWLGYWQTTRPYPAIDRIIPDNFGGLWLKAGTRLYREDIAMGKTSVELDNYFSDATDGVLMDWVINPVTGDLWIAQRKRLQQLNNQGSVLFTRRLDAVTLPERERLRFLALALHVDQQGPELHWLGPVANSTTPPQPELTLSYLDLGIGVDPNTLLMQANGANLALQCQHAAQQAHCQPTIPLTTGTHELTATIQDHYQNQSVPVSRTIQVAAAGSELQLTVAEPADNLQTAQTSLHLKGTLTPETARLTLNDEPVGINQGQFDQVVSLNLGANTFRLDATLEQQHQTKTLTIVRVAATVLQKPNASLIQNQPQPPKSYQITGLAGSVEANSQVILVAPDHPPYTTQADAQGAFSQVIPAVAGQLVTIYIQDALGNRSAATPVWLVELPADPVTVAPPPKVDEPFMETIEFIYTGDDPIQIGLVPGTLEPHRVAVVRGQIVDWDNQPIPGVKVTVLNQPNYGYTRSRADGWYDLVVNGGGFLIVQYEHPAYLSVQRKTQPDWENYAVLDQILLTQRSTQVTPIDLDNPEPQIAQGEVNEDLNGQRQSVLLFNPGTQAYRVTPDGQQIPLTKLEVSITEFTQGEQGQKAMPASLPLYATYTYATKISVGEAVGEQIAFNQPIINYVENYLKFDPGMVIPAGYYDERQGQWVGMPNGRVIKVLAITNGLAEIDSTGDDLADSEVVATDSERQQIAQRYSPGQTLWRVELTHFSTVDYNWYWGCATAFSGCTGFPVKFPEIKPEEPTQMCGSIVQGENQVLGEVISLDDYQAHYASNRSKGGSTHEKFFLPITGKVLPRALKEITLILQLKGKEQRFVYEEEKGEIRPDMIQVISQSSWDRDAYNRLLHGKEVMQVRLGYGYEGILAVSGGRFNVVNTTRGGKGLNLNGNGDLIRVKGAYSYFYNDGQIIVKHPRLDTGITGDLGGWRMGGQYFYDFKEGVLYQDQQQRHIRANKVIKTAGGYGVAGYHQRLIADGTALKDAQFIALKQVKTHANGDLYVSNHDAIYKIAAGKLYRVVGTGQGDSYQGSQDGRIATTINFEPKAPFAFGPDDLLYFASFGKIYQVDAQGIVHLLAGGGPISKIAGPALEAGIGNISGLALDADGTIYFSATATHLPGVYVSRLSAGTIIHLVRTAIHSSANKDLAEPALVELDHNQVPGSSYGEATIVSDDRKGVLYFAANRRIYQIRGDNLSVVTGDGDTFIKDGLPAVQAKMINSSVNELMVHNRELYFSSGATAESESPLHHVVWKIDNGGIVRLVAGVKDYTLGQVNQEDFPTQSRLNNPKGLAMRADSQLYITDQTGGSEVIRQIDYQQPQVDSEEIHIPSEDGQEIYIFNGAGYHQRTVDALTGVALKRFTYDKNRLQQIIDRDGDTTQITWRANQVEILSPEGRLSVMALDGNGYLASVTNAAQETTQFGYDAEGLLRTKTDPRQNTYQMTYTTEAEGQAGLLKRDQNPEGGFLEFYRDLLSADNPKISWRTALNRRTESEVGRDTSGKKLQILTYPNRTQKTLTQEDGTQTIGYSNGEKLTLVKVPDPRFGMQALYLKTLSYQTPAGKTLTLNREKTVEMQDATKITDLLSQTETVTINGKSWRSGYEKASNTLTATSPEGRTRTIILNAQGRPATMQTANWAASHYSYDPHGRIEIITQGEGATQRQTEITYDAAGNIKTITNAEQQSTEYPQYDGIGRLQKVVQPEDRTTQLSYDKNGNLETVIPPEQPAHQLGYNKIDQENSYDPPDIGLPNDKTAYRYNLDKQLTTIERPDGQTITLNYNPSSGQLETLHTPQGDYAYRYNTHAELVQIETPTHEILNLQQDGILPTQETWQGTINGSIQRRYNADFRLESLTVSGFPISYGYDNDGLLTQAGTLGLTRYPDSGALKTTVLGQVTTDIQYNEFAELQRSTASYQGTPFYSQDITERDNLGRIKQQIEAVNGVVTEYDYHYDTAGRLETVLQNGVETARYGYDGNNNRLQYNQLSASYDDQDRLLTYGNNTYTYSANGELESKTTPQGITQYEYDVLGNLQQVVLPDGRVIDYLTDAKGRRIGKKINGVLVQGWLYNGQLSPVAELDGKGQIVARFVYADRANIPSYLLRNNKTYRIIADHLGNPRVVMDTATGAIVQQMNFDEFGRVILDTHPGLQPFGFAGGLYDGDTQLVRFGARDYDAETGRWTAKDPIRFEGGDTNLYGYVLNDPVNWVDSLGLWTNIVINDNFWGYHAGAILGWPGNDAYLFDPGGSYHEYLYGAPGEVLSGQDANLYNYFFYQRTDGSDVTIHSFDTTPIQEALIKERIDTHASCSAGSCASCVSDILKGIGPFYFLEGSSYPWELRDQLNDLQK